MLETFVKTYGDRTYVHTALLRHKGVLVAFALDDRRRMSYSILDPGAGASDADGWFDRAKELEFPGELANVGYGVADQLRLPLVRLDGTRVPAGTPVRADEIDPYLSSTARLTADAPFQVLADGPHIYVLRQSVAAGEKDRIVEVDGPGGVPVPVVNSTLLVDRFVLAGSDLRPAREVRFQRSRSRTRPQSAQDSLGAADLDGNPFIEPTQALRFVTGLTGGRFSVLLLPTSVAEVSRWQIFADNARTAAVDAFSVERSADGLFNTAGTQFYTCAAHPRVFAVEPGRCPEPDRADQQQTCGKELVPQSPAGGYSGTALRFGRDGAAIEGAPGVQLGPAFTIETWINVAADSFDGERSLIGGTADPATAGPTLYVQQGTRLRIGFGDGTKLVTTTTGDILTPGGWNHLAVTFDGTHLRVYADGTLRHRTAALAGWRPAGSPTNRVGATGANGFRGTIDEIRYWNVVRAARDIRSSMHQRLNGLEPGLVAYLRLDEGSGDAVWDLTGREGRAGRAIGTEWVSSGAPVADTPGISRFSFRVAGRRTAGGIASLLYHQQEKVAAGYDTKTTKPLKRNARVMVAVPTTGDGSQPGGQLALFDLGVGVDGKIAQIPADARLSILAAPGTAEGSLDTLLATMAKLESQAGKLRAAILLGEDQLLAAQATAAAISAAMASGVASAGLPAELVDTVNRLATQQADLRAATVATTDIPGAVSRAVALAYEHAHYDGRHLRLSPGYNNGFYNIGDLRKADLNDRISSLIIPPELQLTAYVDQDRSGDRKVFDQHTRDLAGWSDKISSIDVGAHADVRNRLEQRRSAAAAAVQATQTELEGARLGLAQQAEGVAARIAQDQAKLAGVLVQLRRASDALSGEASVQMPLVAIDAAGLAVTGAVLGWAWTKDTPTLFDSALGRVSLYFRGATGDFFVTHYDTCTDRARYSLPVQEGQGAVTLVTRSPELSATEGPQPLDVALTADGPATVTVTLSLKSSGGSVTETWRKVPREVSAFADVLNGRTAQPAYDYAGNASSTLPAADLFRGSQLVRADAAGASGSVGTGAPSLIPATVSSRWFADAPGRALELNGRTAAQGTDPVAFAPAGDLTVESWVRPTGSGDLGRIVLQSSEPSPYQLGLVPQPHSALRFQNRVWAEAPNLDIQGRITIEAWVLATHFTGLQSIVAHGPTGNAEVALRLNNGAWQAGSWDGRDHYASCPPHPEDKDTWVHLAGVHDGRTWTIYRNGVAEGTTAFAAGAVKVDTTWTIGAAAGGDRPFTGTLDEVRIWNRNRSREEIVADMHRRLTGAEPGLAGRWSWAGSSAGPDGLTPHGVLTRAEPPMPAYRAVAAVGAQAVQSRDLVPGNTWSHLAMTFDRSYGVRLGGNGAHLDCGTGDILDLSSDLTIEVGVNIDTIQQAHGLVSRGLLSSDEGADSPYNLVVERGGQVAFLYKDSDGTIQRVASTQTIGWKTFHRITVTRRHGTEVDSAGAVSSWDDIRIYLQGKPAGHRRETKAKVWRSAGATRIGQAWYANGQQADLRGSLAEVRLWSVARDPAAITATVKGDEAGLVGWWRFDENEGRVATDAKSRIAGRFQGDVSWVPTPDPTGSALTLYLDGRPAATTPFQPATAASAAARFAVGDSLRGQLEELRIWKTTRTTEQIQDSLFRRLTGEQRDLIAYYTFDPDRPDVITDQGLRGNDLKPNGTELVLSTAPISEDQPEVRNALLQLRTDHNGRIDGRPAVAEYADLQTDANNQQIGVFKRCYASVRDGHWRLVTGFKVGDMTAEWIGQVQFAPQLMGYIEGAPPVPAENLTTAKDYTGASSVTLTDALTTTYTYASDRNSGFDSAIEAALKYGAGTEVTAGVGVETRVLKIDGSVGLKTSFEVSQSWRDIATAGQGRATTRVSTLALRGRRQGDRWAPDNVGYALVQSETADVFAMRLVHTGALIAYEMRPNPDIPKDWNIITFPLNRFYTKQGTLDGKAGLDPDEDYPNAGTYSPDRSYFKPIEAYQLKNRIQREEAQLRTLFDQFGAGAAGRNPGEFPGQLPRLEKRNLVNTYVWTADGGQFSEVEQNLDIRSETTGGAYAFKGLAGLVGELKIQATATFSAELSALFGGHLNLSVTKAVASDSRFGVAVTVAPESAIFAPDGTERTPGKVDAYRFLTFYLEPAVESFDRFFNQVVDPIWLAEQSSPAAVALAGAQQATTRPPCWRIMHRVTYVSRVLPKLADQPSATPLEKALIDLDIASNYQLIKTLEPFVRDHTGSIAGFARAVRTAVAAHLPDLQQHEAEILDFLVRYYGITDAPSLSPESQDDTSRLAAEPPVVQAAATPAVTTADAAELSGTVVDEVLDAASIPVAWTAVTAPGQVTIANPEALVTTARFAQPGTYVLRLTAKARIAAHADTTVTVSA